MTLEELEKNCVFRYRMMNKNTMREVLDAKIWHSTIEGLNDPFEFPITLEWKKLINANPDVLAEYAKHFDMFSLDEILYYLCSGKIEEFRSIITNNLNKLKNSLPRYYGSLFVACFSGNMKSPLMWSHYADGMKGVCIAYNRDCLEKTNAFKLYPIKYNKAPIAMDYSHLKMVPVREDYSKYDFEINDTSVISEKLVRLNSYEYLYQKHDIWNYENEFRNIIDPNSKRSDPQRGGLIDFPREAVSAIIVGSKIKKNHKKMVFKYGSANNIPIYIASPDLGDYTVMIEPL
jgi:hypothetical protein